MARVAVPAALAALISDAAHSFLPFAHGELASFMAILPMLAADMALLDTIVCVDIR